MKLLLRRCTNKESKLIIAEQTLDWEPSPESGDQVRAFGNGFAWKADCLFVPLSKSSEDDKDAVSPPLSPILSFDIPTSSSTFMGAFECTAVGLIISCA